MIVIAARICHACEIRYPPNIRSGDDYRYKRCEVCNKATTWDGKADPMDANDLFEAYYAARGEHPQVIPAVRHADAFLRQIRQLRELPEA